MKTSEFVKRINELGYKTFNHVDRIIVYGDSSIVAKVYKNKVNMLDTDWNENVPDELLHILVEYARTPIEERQDVKKYYLYNPVKGAYFNYYFAEKGYDWFDSKPTHNMQTQFTEEEIKNHKFRDIMELLVKEEV